jgi:RIO kinase 1
MSKEKFKVYEGVFDEFTLSSLELLRRKGYYDTLKSPIKTGKEGDVYLAEKENSHRAIKIYRVTSANFKKISKYIQRDYRFQSIKGNMRKVILAWAQKEYRNLKICYKEGLNVPQPFKQYNNIIIMQYLDAPMLKDITLENPKFFFELLMEQLLMLKEKAQLIHGDLSQYNILVKDQIPYLIDFGQAMTFKNESEFARNQDLFERDIQSILSYFNRYYDLELKEEEIINQLTQKG